jgi:hypothetical protein
VSKVFRFHSPSLKHQQGRKTVASYGEWVPGPVGRISRAVNAGIATGRAIAAGDYKLAAYEASNVVNPFGKVGKSTSLLHKNHNKARGNFVIYQARVKGHTWKIGKADADRVNSQKIPTRMAQQDQILKKYLKLSGKDVDIQEIARFNNITTQKAKQLERYYQKMYNSPEFTTRRKTLRKMIIK